MCGATTMPVLSDIKSDFNIEEFAKALCNTHSILEKIIDEIKESFNEAMKYARPMAIYEITKVEKFENGNMEVSSSSDGKRYNLKPGGAAPLLEHAELIFACVSTIGPDIDAKIQQTSLEKDYLAGYLLDSIATYILCNVTKAVNKIVEQAAKKLNFGLSPAISPGSGGPNEWPMSGQEQLYSMLDIGLINVTMGKNFILSPSKSYSYLVGLGAGYGPDAKQVASLCEECVNRGTCWLRNI